MIEILKGTHETINFRDSLGVRLFHNVDYEDYPEHWHTAIEMIMPIKNSYGVQTGEREYVLREGEILLINSGVLHALKAPPAGERIILQFSDYLLYFLKEVETLLALLPPVIYLSPEKDDKRLYSFIKRQMDAIVVEYDQEKTFFQAAIYARLIEIFIFLGRSEIWGRRPQERMAENNPVKKKEYMEVVMGACNYINKHFSNPITLDEVAEVSGFSKFHFTRIFKQCMNMTFYEYLNHKRVSKAEELLSGTSRSMAEIAMQSGFSSISAFNRTFKSEYGCSPSMYRNKKDRMPEEPARGHS